MMSSGAGMRFEVRNGTRSGIFWETEPPKQKPRKFGYKSKGLRHPIRKPEPQAMPESFQTKKPTKDFIRKNREQFQLQKSGDSDSNHSSSSQKPSTHIKPGTVTLTQDQLNSLLASIGKYKPGQASNVRISVDTETNEIQVESPAPSDQESPRNSVSSDINNNDTIPSKGLGGTASLLDLVNKKVVDDSQKEAREDIVRKKPVGTKEVRFNTGPSEAATPSEPQSSSSIPPLVPWKHMTVAERKRLEWEREKAAAAQREEIYDPWGKPGAGAPLRQADQKENEKTTLTKEQEKREQAIDGIEEKYKTFFASEQHDKNKDKKYEKKPPMQAESHSDQEHNTSYLEKKGNRRPSVNRSQRLKEDSRDGRGTGEGKRNEHKGKNDGKDGKTASREKKNDQNLKKEGSEGTHNEKGERKEQSWQKKEEHSREQRERVSKRSYSPGTEKEDFTATNEGREAERKESVALKLPDLSNKVPAAMQTSIKIGEAEPDNRRFLSKKEEERRKWLEELDRQREEKRLEKQREQELRQKGIDDTWADRFVHKDVHKVSTASHPPPAFPPSFTQQTSDPAQPRTGPILPGRADVYSRELPPPAMRASLLIGEAAPKNDQIKSRQEEEKRLWLEELNKQREEQREARMRLKEKQLASEETWANRFSEDTRQAAVGPGSHYSVADPVQQTGRSDLSAGRVSSAPEPHPLDTFTHDASEPRSFLRGQNVYIDPVTLKELETKRKQQLEHQAAIKAQIAEKEHIKREEQKRKWKEDAEEERRLAAEREQLQQQLMMEQNKVKQKEEARQKQVENVKHMMDTEQGRAQEQRMMKRLAILQQGGHDVSSLKAHYDEITPRFQHVSVEPAAVPGLSLSPRDPGNTFSSSAMPGTSRTGEMFMASHSQDNAPWSVSHQPYTENRILTPSQLRKPSQPWSDPNSPRREFATQTEGELHMGGALSREASEVEIEYRPKPTRKQVQVKSAENHRSRDQKSVSLASKQQISAKNERRSNGKPPSWNYQNQKRKPPVKQSEKDLFHEQKRQKTEERRANRERQLQYLVELNKDITPAADKHTPRDRSPGQHLEGKGDEERHGQDPTRARQGFATGRLQKKTSPRSNDMTHQATSSAAASNGAMSRQSRSHSPPVPAVRHKVGKNPTGNFEADYDVNAHSYKHHQNAEPDLKPVMDDKGNITVPAKETDFIPIRRTADVLDPSRAKEPIQLSRENTRVTRARQHYHENLHPADYGGHLDVHSDKQRQPAPALKDPILNPSLVREHPTARQDLILKQLSTLKQSLIQRQRELETYMSSNDFEKQV